MMIQLLGEMKERHRASKKGETMEKQSVVKQEYLISEASKEVHVENHVLRYWEEELGLPIKRNDKGHRYYTREDIVCFQKIKALKEKGLQLKAIKSILETNQESDDMMEAVTSGGDIFNMPQGKILMSNVIVHKEEPKMSIEVKEVTSQNNIKKGYLEKEAAAAESGKGDSKREQERELNGRDMLEAKGALQELSGSHQNMSKEANQNRMEKLARAQFLIQSMISNAVKENNKQLLSSMKEVIAKEMDYQFRMQEEERDRIEEQRMKREEEREEARKKADDEHYQKIDETLRNLIKKSKRKSIL